MRIRPDDLHAGRRTARGHHRGGGLVGRHARSGGDRARRRRAVDPRAGVAGRRRHARLAWRRRRLRRRDHPVLFGVAPDHTRRPAAHLGHGVSAGASGRRIHPGRAGARPGRTGRGAAGASPCRRGTRHRCHPARGRGRCASAAVHGDHLRAAPATGQRAPALRQVRCGWTGGAVRHRLPQSHLLPGRTRAAVPLGRIRDRPALWRLSTRALRSHVTLSGDGSAQAREAHSVARRTGTIEMAPFDSRMAWSISSSRTNPCAWRAAIKRSSSVTPSLAI